MHCKSNLLNVSIILLSTFIKRAPKKNKNLRKRTHFWSVNNNALRSSKINKFIIRTCMDGRTSLQVPIKSFINIRWIGISPM